MRLNIKPYLDLCRVSNLPTVWTNVLAAVVLSGVDFSWPKFLLLLFSLSLFYSGGMCLNDLCDATPDRTHKPFRPIPSGRISVQDARLFTVVLFVLAFVVLLLLPYRISLLTGILLLALIIVYDRIHKAHPSSVILMGACRFMVLVVSAVAVSGTVNGLVGLAGFLQFAYVLIITVVSRYEGRSGKDFSFPVIPVMLASISFIDGIMMALFASPFWLLAGMGGAVFTHLGQRYVRGD
jgi:4-hydroxybenzoate polyprenyltransferase